MRNLLTMLAIVVSIGNIRAQSIDEWYLDYSGPSSHTINQLPPGTYTLKVSGVFCGGSCWGENGTDAAYALPSQNPWGGRSFTVNEYCPQGWEGSGDCAFLRPTPDVYSPAHEYDYLIDHTGGDFTVFGLADDCCWGDNTGGLAFELHPASPFSECFDFEWLTTDTIIGIAGAELSIEVNPFDNSGLAQEVWHNTYPASGAPGGFSQSVIYGDSVFIAGATWPGSTTDQLMTCITRDGSLVWQQVRAPGGDHDGFFTLCQDGNRLLFGGSQNAQGTNYFDATWVATDLSGSELDFNFSPVGGTSGAKDFLQLPNGTILLSHYQWPNGSVMRLDENDEVSAQSSWHNLGTYSGPVLTLSDEPDAFFFVGAASNSHVTIRRYSEDLTEQINWDLDLDFPVYIYDATWQDGHLFLAGRTTDSNSSGLLLKVDESGISEMHIDTTQSSFFAIQASAGEVWTTKSYGTDNAYSHSSFGKAFDETGYEEMTVLNGGMPFVPYSISGDELDFFITGTEGTTYWQASAPAASRVTVETTNLDSLIIEWSNGEIGQSITTTLSASQWLSVDVTLGNCQWQDSVYINIEVPGCTDMDACNFDSAATEDDGSCTISPVLTLPTDTSTFESTLLLDAGPDLGTYLWSTGETGETITVTESGQYSVQVMQNGSVNRSVHFDATSTEQADFSAVTSAFDNEGTIAIDFKIDSPDSATPDLGGTWSMPSYPLFLMDNGAQDPLAIRIGRGCSAAEASITLEDDDCGQSNPHVRASWGTDPLHFFDGQWHRIVLSSGAEGHALYVDGALLSLDYSLGDQSINVWPGDANAFLIGRELNADWDFVGDLDNLMVWSSPLAFNQASSLDPCQFNPTSPDLLGFWPFNGSDASVALDASGNNQHGMLDASRTMQPAQTACSPCFAESTVMVQLLISNCTDSLACNYNAMATLDDGSCDYSCCPGPGCCADGTEWDIELEQCVGQSSPCDTVFLPIPSCGPGTVWDPVNEECIIAIPADLNYDGCVSVNDLLLLLAVHGTCPPYPEWPDEPTDTTWSCGDSLTYWDYDYATVLIGDQCWFAENCRYLPAVSLPGSGSESDGEPHAYVYDYSGTDIDSAMQTPQYLLHGALYNFQAATTWEICPSGWHVPTKDEFRELDIFLGLDPNSGVGWSGMNLGIGDALKSQTGWCCNDQGNNTTGFTAIGSGGRWDDDVIGFHDLDNACRWWTQTPSGNMGWHHDVAAGYPGIYWKDDAPKARGHSVRCIKD